ncbi:hypothetical protein L6164_028386 [Bauhinia variegata]|uniref:Uncharacterized protein n=1 Tax=Bauhinia variegata TaxID=167791 RepID=A0ACB9L6J1_BAUVA|nr:hypothetical protein L6164_028386 [Bauhinia variegata]
MAQPNAETQQVDQSLISFSTGAFSDPPAPFSPPSEEREHNQHKAYLMSFPPGYRFCPTDEELIRCYLTKKIKNEKLPPSIIVEENIYRFHPENLAGKAPKGDKTNWIMHEYRMNQPPRTRVNSNDMRLDDWVLCKIHKKNENTKGKKDVEAKDQRTEDRANNENNETVAEFNPNILAASQTKGEEAINGYLHQSSQMAPPLILPPIQASALIYRPHPQLPRYPLFTSVEEQFMHENMYHSRLSQFDPLSNNYSNASWPQQIDPLPNNHNNSSRSPQIDPLPNNHSNSSRLPQIDPLPNNHSNSSRLPQIDPLPNNYSYVNGPPRIDPLHSHTYYYSDEHQCNYVLPQNFANDPLNNPIWGIYDDADYQSEEDDSKK